MEWFCIDLSKSLDTPFGKIIKQGSEVNYLTAKGPVLCRVMKGVRHDDWGKAGDRYAVHLRPYCNSHDIGNGAGEELVTSSTDDNVVAINSAVSYQAPSFSEEAHQARVDFVDAVNGVPWNNKLRTESETLLILYDQMLEFIKAVEKVR